MIVVRLDVRIHSERLLPEQQRAEHLVGALARQVADVLLEDVAEALKTNQKHASGVSDTQSGIKTTT